MSAVVGSSRLAVVTGAGSGIGRSLAIVLAHRGLRVLVVGRREEKLIETRALAPHDMVEIACADISQEEGRTSVVDKVMEMGDGSLAYLVHNAGVLGPVEPLSDVKLDEFRHVMSVNVEGPLFLTQRLLPALKRTVSSTTVAADAASSSTPTSSSPPALTLPRVLHVSSGAAHKSVAGWGSYCASKAALYSIYRVARDELRPAGVLIGSARPGVVDTDMQAQIRSADEASFPAKHKFVALKEGADAAAAAAEAATAAAETTAAVAAANAPLVGAGRPPPAGALDSCANVGVFLSWLLLDTGDEEFCGDEWDIRDDFHHPRWQRPTEQQLQQ